MVGRKPVFSLTSFDCQWECEEAPPYDGNILSVDTGKAVVSHWS